MLSKLSPKEARFKVNLIGGREVEITLRPFTLGDKAWMENSFDTTEKALSVANMEAEAWARILWHQMDIDSRDIFMNIAFQKVDEKTNKVTEIKPEGYERLLEALYSVKDILEGIEAFNLCQGNNGFTDDGLKKKTA